jgi:Zn-dependent protease
MIDVLLSNPLGFLVLIVCLIFSITIHEFAHAWVAYKLGDPTPKYQGRVTLNPLSHIDPVGMILLVIAGFGWGRPVEYDLYSLRHPKRDVLLISIAGPLSNFLIAFLFLVIGKFVGYNLIISQLVYLNLVLGVFNLLPIHPLDGFKVVTGLLPYNLAYKWQDLENYGIYILLIFLFTDAFKYTVLPVVSMILSLMNLLI